MADQQIANPDAAFALPSATITGVPGVPDQTIKSVYNSGSVAIKVGGWVTLDVTGTAGHWNGVIAGLHGGTTNQVVGIALDAIPVAGFGRICTSGPCMGIAGAAGVTAGNQLVPSTVSTDDQELVVSSSPANGTVVGTCLQTQATHGSLFFVWVKLT